ncbi:unnamed protein product, partial [Ectocarpus sp. 13 AM-2016]
LQLALLGAYAASGIELYSENIAHTGPPETLGTGQCIPCEGLFARLEEATNGKLQQSSHIELRGEPKSGTHLSWSWAEGILTHTCEHLQDMYGSDTCIIEYIDGRPNNMRMVFEPGLARSDEHCSCQGISRVEVAASTRYKHVFPVPKSCRWKHSNGILHVGEGCGSVNGVPVENAADLWLCMKEASCEYSDDSLQFAVLRDPRAVAVSTYFYVQERPNSDFGQLSKGKSLDEAVLLILPQVCQFTTIRHILFDGQMSDRSEVFWYEDALRDPVDWHYRWASLAGFSLPTTWMKDVNATLTKGQQEPKRDRHPGGLEVSSNRTWELEVSPGIREEMDAILRTWLPGVLLARLGVPARE